MKEYRGPLGSAVECDIDPTLSGSETTIASWLLTGPWHPLWSQFVIACVHLRDVKGVPPANLKFEGATHELMVVALNPGNPPKVHPQKTFEKGGFKAVGGYLSPIDFIDQFTASDEEMKQLVTLCAAACVNGGLNPLTDDAREYLREGWLTACIKTLAHMRGEAHES